MTLTRILVLIVSACIAAPVVAQPPPHAKAHGWRKKNDPNYVGYTGKKWEKDYGIIDGHCDAKTVGAVVGAVIGGAVGARTGDRETRPVAIVVGAALGALIGARIGKAIDETDRACMGHALELAGQSKSVRWKNDATGVTYLLTPTRDLGDRKNPCREFTLLVESGARKETLKDTACRRGAGDWAFKG
jgi:surface antigen